MTADDPPTTKAPSAPRVSQRRETDETNRFRRFALPGAIVVLAALSTVWLDVIARHATSSNSDSATVVLEGQAMSAGHLLLSGWTLSLDSFWTVDVPFYAAAVRVAGVSRNLIYTVPVVIAALTFLVVALMAVGRRRNVAALIGVVVAGIPLLTPARSFSTFYLQGPFHVATTLWALLAFWLLANCRFGWRWAIAVVLLVAGALGDFQATALSMVPVFLIGLLVADSSRSWRRSLPLLSAPVVAVVSYYVIREMTKHLGGFSIGPTNSIASWHQRAHNLAHIPSLLWGLAGVGSGTFGATGVSSTLQAFGFVRLLIFIGGPLVVLFAAVYGLRRGRRNRDALSTDAILDGFIVLAFVIDLAMFVLLPLTSSPAYARYLSPLIIFGTLLSARVATRALSSTTPAVTRVALACALVFGGLFEVSALEESQGNPVYQPAATMAAFLGAQHLTSGVGDYWSASITTVESDDVVHVRPVISYHGHLVRYEKNAARDWYAHRRFNFFVFEPTSIWNGDTARAATRDWGPPSRIWRIGPYKILVFPHYFSVPLNGWTGP